MSIASLLAGPLVDRLDRRRVLMVSSLVVRLPTLVLLLLWWQGGLAMWHICLALVVNGLANAFVLPAYDAWRMGSSSAPTPRSCPSAAWARPDGHDRTLTAPVALAHSALPAS